MVGDNCPIPVLLEEKIFVGMVWDYAYRRFGIGVEDDLVAGDEMVTFF